MAGFFDFPPTPARTTLEQLADSLTRPADRPTGQTLAEIFASPPRPRTGGLLSGLSAYAAAEPMTPLARALLAPTTRIPGQHMQSTRTRSEWNDRFSHWQKPESGSETDQIVRARDMVADTLRANEWLKAERVNLIPQGSYTNRTNTRRDADIDLRVQHPSIRIIYVGEMDTDEAWHALGYARLNRPIEETNRIMRDQVFMSLMKKFGVEDVESGNKAFEVAALDGSRAKVDVVPVFRHHRVHRNPRTGQFWHVEGVAILGQDGNWTYNFPEQHLANGKEKRVNTEQRFKRFVRVVKRLRRDMQENGALDHDVPSFLIECLIYLVEDWYFTGPQQDDYDRIRVVLTRCEEIISLPDAVATCREINEIKPLFGDGQKWTIDEARDFVRRALVYLGDV